MEGILDLTELEKNSIEEKVLASKTKRFFNYLVDIIAYYILSIVIGGLMGVLLVVIGQEQLISQMDGTNLGVKVFTWVFGLTVLTLYYAVSEYFFNGKTLGKLITKTRAVTVDNQRMDFKQTMKRSLCRLIPFESFSFFGEVGSGWHDTMSKTKVIED